MALAWPAVAVAILTAWFSWRVTKQFVSKKRPHLFFWSLSLILACLASVAYAICLNDSARFFFELYYLFGAMWMPSIMGLGSVALVAGKRLIWVLAAAVGALGLCGSVGMLLAPVRTAGLTHLDGGAGTGVVQAGWWLPFLIVLNSFGALAVIVVALISAWRTIRKSAPGRFFAGNIWLAVGVLIVSMAGSAARLGWPGLFWITMLVGWVVTYVGYSILTPRQAVRMTPEAVSEPAQ